MILQLMYRMASVALVVFLIGTAPARGQFPLRRSHVSEAERKLPVDYAAFASDSSGLVRLEVYYQIYNFVLEFEPDGKLFKAAYDVSVSVLDSDGRRVASGKSSGDVAVSTRERAESISDFRIRQVGFDLPVGKYKAAVVLRDRNSGKMIRRDFDVKLKWPIGKFPTLSDVELIQLAERGQPISESFGKGDMNLVPSATGIMGGTGKPRLLYYFEIYSGRNRAEEVLVETLLRKRSGRMVYRDSLTVPLTGWRSRQLREVSLGGFQPGAYELEIVLRGRRNKKLDRKKKDFSIAWTAEALLAYNYEVAVDQLAYIGSNEEIDRLREVTAPEERKRAFEEFWSNHDPSPGTPENELRREFYQRISVANERFSAFNRDGWRTDRGRIYIQYGEPDRIEDQPMGLGEYPYQRWYYFRYGAYRVFTFVDQFEDGDYRLQYPYDGIY